MKEHDRTHAPRRRHAVETGTFAAIAVIAAAAVLIGFAGFAARRAHDDAAAGQAATGEATG